MALGGVVPAARAQNFNFTLRDTMVFDDQRLANIWGYAAGGHEYALVGAKQGTFIVDVTNPDDPELITQIPGPASDWREIKTYQHYAYVVSEGGGAIQIINLNNLPGTNLAYHSVNGGSGITRGHALHIDELKGFLYVHGSNLNGGRPQVYNLNADPYNPTYSGFVNFIGYSHDGYAYNDMLYAGHIYAGQFSVVNMANKSNPVLLGTQTTPGAFTHNTWKSGTTLFTTDEVSNSFLTAYNVANPANITQLDKIQVTPGSGSIVHNTHVIDDYAVTSWYKDGVVIVDGLRPSNLVVTAHYDTYSSGSGNGFEGCWGVYPYLPSGNIVASNIRNPGTNDGVLYVLTPNYVRGCYLEGVVTDSASGQPIPGAFVSIAATNKQEYTNAFGEYKMAQVESGSFTVQVSYPGYNTFTTTVSLNNGVLTTLNVILAPPPVKGPLPVELVRFDAEAQDRHVQLRWETATEINNAGFEVQQSPADEQQWQNIGWVLPKGDGASPAQYEYSTPALAPGRYAFRLRQVDRDGQSALSPIRLAAIYGAALQLSVSPNPAASETRIRISTAKPAEVNWEILDARGQPTGLTGSAAVDGVTEISLSLADLPAGIYYVTANTGRESVRQVLVKP